MKTKLDHGVALRIAIDAAIFAFALFLALALRYLTAILYEGAAAMATSLLATYIEHFLICAPLLLLVGVGSFSFFGLYNRARSYNWRAKGITVLKASTVPYLILPLIVFFVPGLFTLPRAVLFVAWALTTVIFLLSRLWSNIWRQVVIKETHGAIAPSRDEKKVLLIGGAGYIGSALLPRLLESGYHVRLLDIFMYGKEPIQGALNHPNLELVEGDFRRVEKVVSSMRGVGSVIHLGGLVGDPACALDEKLTTEINLVATRVVAEVAKGEGVQRFIFASTCSVYGASDGILDENSRLNPVSLYARSKIASERVLLDARNGFFSPVMLRFGTIFGLSGRTRFDLVVNLLAAKAIFDGKITLYGGDQWRPFVHVDDAARAVMTVLKSPLPSVAGEIFNIGGDDLNYTLRDVGEMIQKMVPSAELLDLGANADLRNYRVDFRKARTMLGFQPKWKLNEGIAQVIEAIRSGKVQDYTLAKYSNVKFLSDEKLRVLGKDDGWEERVLAEIGPTENTLT